MGSWLNPPSPGQLQRQARNRRFGHPTYQYEVAENNYPDFYYPRPLSDPWATYRFGSGGRARGCGIMAEGRRGVIDEQKESDGQVEEVVNGRHTARASLGDARYGNPIRQENLRDAVSFELAITGLHQQIMKSEGFYRMFKTGYESDIENIKKYVSEKTLVEIWVQKVKGDNHPQVASGAASGQFGSNDELIEIADKFQVAKRKLQAALADASGSTLDRATEHDRSGTIRDKSAKRLKEWVRVAQLQLPPLLELVIKSPENCDDLLKELRKLKGLFDPNDQNNKPAVHSGVDGADQGAGDGIGDGNNTWS